MGIKDINKVNYCCWVLISGPLLHQSSQIDQHSAINVGYIDVPPTLLLHL